MAVPTLTPSSTTSRVALTSTGSYTAVTSLPFGIYSDSTAALYSTDFISGAVDQVAYTYKKLGGDVLDIELAPSQVYAAYEESTLEYCYLVNIHQAKNTLGSALGNTTGTFDHDGNIKTASMDSLSGSLSGSHVALKYPRFDFSYSRNIGESISSEANIGGYEEIYSASFAVKQDVSDYDLQSIIASSSDTSGLRFSGKVGNVKLRIKRVYYKTPAAMWRFYGYYGGLNVVGNLSSYGQFADDSTFQIVPTWQSKAQGMAFDDAMNVRLSSFSYELKDNYLRLYPSPTSFHPKKMWVQFTIPTDAWDGGSRGDHGVDGVNNMNTLPLGNIPYENINSIGKQWIRRFSLAVIKEMLGQVRSKFSTIPIPGESVTLNGPSLISEGKEEQSSLREELKTVLDELTYVRLVENETAMIEGTNKVQGKIPMEIFMG